MERKNRVGQVAVWNGSLKINLLIARGNSLTLYTFPHNILAIPAFSFP